MSPAPLEGKKASIFSTGKEKVIGTWYRCMHCSHRVYSSEKLCACPKCRKPYF